MKRQVVLTVSESKRLIARGIVMMPEVKRAMAEGMVVVAQGTTNAFILEELLGRNLDKRRYLSGITTPKEPERLEKVKEEPIPDVVFKNGEIARELDRYNAVEHMGKGDVYLKGANALNYRQGLAGVLIGSSTGGTVGRVLGSIIGKKIDLIIPVGLEKLVFEDINKLHKVAAGTDYEGPSLWPITGKIMTEIEAFQLLTGVKAYLYSAGGIAGAEGSVRLLLDGTEEQVEAALELVKSIGGEPRFLL